MRLFYWQRKGMKAQKILLVLICLFAVSQFSFGQKKPQAVLLDEFGKICSEDLMARFDGYFYQLNSDPTAIGYFIFNGDESAEGRNLNFIYYLSEFYPKMRGFDKTRLALLRGKNQGEMKVQFWVVSAGANPPQPQNKFISEKIISTTLFDKSWADFNKDYGKLDVYSKGFLDLGCDFSPNRSAFAKTLLSNDELTGYLIIYTKFGKNKKYADRIANFALRELTKTFKVPRNRLKTIYGGNREEPGIEFWFVPKDKMPPKPTLDR